MKISEPMSTMIKAIWGAVNLAEVCRVDDTERNLKEKISLRKHYIEADLKVN